MKKPFTICIALFLIITFMLPTAASESYTPDDLSVIESKADVIVKGILYDDAEELFEPLPPGVEFAQTVSTLKVVEVYKGCLKKDDKIKLAEDYWYIDGEQAHWAGRSDYLPSEPGKDYFFFLMAPTYESGRFLSDCYLPIRREYGRYPVPAPNVCLDSLTNEELNLDPDEAPEVYMKLYQEVLAKYNG